MDYSIYLELISILMQTEPTAPQSQPDPNSNPNSSGSQENHYLRNALSNLRIFLTQTLRIEGNAHPEETIESIKADIDFKGYNVWILIFSILIASIGLNVNSGAVVIGAMLISPLMGPILGVGLSMGTNDWLTLKRSFRNFAIMFTVSIITSTLYFSLTPLVDAQSELLARIRPTLLDVFVAFIGGLAGILAANRRIKSNVVPGVAIATALMPPLCTAGYGFATGQWDFLFGAFYLFLINSIFISLATFVIVRFLNFPVKEFVDEARARKARRYMAIVLILIVGPSGYTFYNVVTESIFNRRVESFITENVFFEGAELLKSEVVFQENGAPTISLSFYGEQVPESLINSWRAKLGNYGLEASEVKVFQGGVVEQMNSEEVTKLVDVYTESRKEIQSKDETIARLRLALEKNRESQIPIAQISKELSTMYDGLYSLSLARMVEYREGRTDTLLMAELKWQMEDTIGLDKSCRKIGAFLSERLAIDTVAIQRKLMPLPEPEPEVPAKK